jgi:hypothetical protein
MSALQEREGRRSGTEIKIKSKSNSKEWQGQIPPSLNRKIASAICVAILAKMAMFRKN